MSTKSQYIVEMSEHAKSTVFTKTSLFEFAAKNSDRTYISIHENVFDVTQFLEEVYIVDILVVNL